MGFYVLHDPEARRAVLFDSTSERPIDLSAFMGASADTLAESFLAFLHTDRLIANGLGDFLPRSFSPPDPADPCCYTAAGLERALDEWRTVCFDEDDDYLTEYGTLLWEWWQGSRTDPAPMPAEVAT